VLKKYVHIGFAADTPNGLVVPVVRDCDRKGVMQIAANGRAGRQGARGQARPGGDAAAAASRSARWAASAAPRSRRSSTRRKWRSWACRADMQPVWNGKEFAPRLMLPLSLSYDHRVIDGAAAARFTVHLAAILADMRRVLL
jgi:pyruvate dehydrogenase E2 component (dihydrolipoamide acetyltransferase)